LMHAADGAIVSSALKRHGKIENSIDPIRVSQFVEAMQLGANSQSIGHSIASYDSKTFLKG
jgi:uncharacterized protein